MSTFDVYEFQFEIKEDLFGLGYKRLDVGGLFGKGSSASLDTESPAASLLFPMMSDKAKSNNKKAIKGHAFGVGDFEDDDDVDIYRQDNMNSYDFELGGKTQTDTRKLLNKTYGFGAFENDVTILEKFSKSKIRQEPGKFFPPPQIPPNFNLMHKFSGMNVADEAPKFPTTEKDSSMNTYLKSVSERAELLGEKPIQPESVFDLLNKEDKDFLKTKQQKILDQQNTKPTEQELKEQKEKRYEAFVSFIKKNYSSKFYNLINLIKISNNNLIKQKLYLDPYNFVENKDLTEWEKEKEKEEFQNRYQQQIKKLEAMKSQGSRFVSTATLNEQNQEVESTKKDVPTSSLILAGFKPVDQFEPEPDLTEMEKAAKEKKFGKLTRTEYEWRPHPVVCKRFNIPNPHPE